MTRRELLKQTENALASGGIENAPSEARWLLENFFSLSENEWFLNREKNCTQTEAAAVEELTRRRISGEPLQYLIGRWPFLSLSLYVGPGVLIPRPETEQLCQAAAENLKEGSSILDLCSGSGAVGLGICSLKKAVSADGVELSRDAFSYLERNLNQYPYKTRAISYDVLNRPDCRFGQYDLIVSNPPYIADKELSALPRELSFEPEMALSGGEDGLLFYRAILANWLTLLRPGGSVYFEIGENQGEKLRELLYGSGLSDIRILKDFSGNDRIASARKED